MNADPRKLIRKRPTETISPIAMIVALFIGDLAGLDQQQTVYLAAIVGFSPVAITWLVELIRR